MNTNNAEDRAEHEPEPKPIKYQVYLGNKLQVSLERYIQDNYPPRTHVKTAVIRKAVMEFLRKESYYGST